MDATVKRVLILFVGINLVHIVVDGAYSLLGGGAFKYSLRDFLVYLAFSVVVGVWVLAGKEG